MQSQDADQLTLRSVDGIPSHAEMFYIVMLRSQIDAALDCFEKFKKFSKDSSNSETAIIWFSQSLAHISAVSRFFWPTRSRIAVHKSRGEILRKAFSVEDGCALNNRNLRNTFEHLDEKMDIFFQKERADCYAAFLVDKSDPRECNSISLITYVNPVDCYAVILDERFEYKAIFEELTKLRKRVYEAYRASRLNRN
jgi:hypothetical protein